MVGGLDKTSLVEAVKRGNVDVVQSLLDSQSDVDEVTIMTAFFDQHGASLGHVAARSGSLQILIDVVRKYPKLASARSVVGATPLHDAAVTGNMECVQWLIQEASCDPDEVDDNGNNAVHLGAR